MIRYRHQIVLGTMLIICSVIVYIAHYFIFRDPHHIFIYLVGDIAFVFIEVLLVTLIIHQVLSEHEKQTRLQKLNMVIGVFFSEVGTELLTIFSDTDPALGTISSTLVDKGIFEAETFDRARKHLLTFDYKINISHIDLSELRAFLTERRNFLLRLLENPNLLEHESFTELLRAVFHLTEELYHREIFAGLPETDLEHLANDCNRAYKLLAAEWVDYMKHLRDNYPYLFSLSVRTNPFDRTASAVVI
ncbi:hypothetical protein ACFL55_02900 [Candidatus Latescibacterota bacterium]